MRKVKPRKLKQPAPQPAPVISGVTFQHTDGRRADVAIALAKAAEKNAEAIIAITKLGAPPPSMLKVSDSTGFTLNNCSFTNGEEGCSFQNGEEGV